MLDGISQNILAILAISVGGVSLGSVLAGLAYMIRYISKSRKQDNMVRQSIITGFENAVLPKNLKVDVSSKIKKPITDGVNEIESHVDAKIDAQNEKIDKLNTQNILMLKILSKFAHVSQLTLEEQNQLSDLLNNNSEDEVEL